MKSPAPLLLALAFATALPGLAPAQQGRVPMQNRWPGEAQQLPQQSAEAPPAPAIKRAQPQPARVVACAGAFARASSHLKLAEFFGSENISWAPVDGPGGSKIDASVLYPNDPKRRLEVLWNSETSRSDTALIAINGQSTWVAPKGLKLGLPLAALEKINGRPFRLSGFGKDNGGTVVGWEGGALGALPGGCKVGIRLAPDPKANEAARAQVAGDKEFASNDPLLRAVAPKIEEILVGY